MLESRGANGRDPCACEGAGALTATYANDREVGRALEALEETALGSAETPFAVGALGRMLRWLTRPTRKRVVHKA